MDDLSCLGDEVLGERPDRAVPAVQGLGDLGNDLGALGAGRCGRGEVLVEPRRLLLETIRSLALPVAQQLVGCLLMRLALLLDGVGRRFQGGLRALGLARLAFDLSR
ncbi:hypothetical protein ACWDKQ_24105 [Saccharopolyspora sp. NPDC000995]